MPCGSAFGIETCANRGVALQSFAPPSLKEKESVEAKVQSEVSGSAETGDDIMCPSRIPNQQILHELNQANGITAEHRNGCLQWLLEQNDLGLRELISRYMASMQQNQDAGRIVRNPVVPEIIRGAMPISPDETVDILGIGGMFAYLNTLYHVHKHGGKHAIITNPNDIFTFSGWTVHPEEDMDQRLIEMFQTKSILMNEAKRILGLSPDPQSLCFKAFRIDYRGIIGGLGRDFRQGLKNFKVPLQYGALELTDRDQRWAKTNLQRNAATLGALEQMNLIGDNPQRDVINLCGRVVFEVAEEGKIAWKTRLKEQYGLTGKRLSLEEVQKVYGAPLPILQDMRDGKIEAVRYPGGHFVLGFKENALKSAREKGVRVYDNATVTKILVDDVSEKYAAAVKLANGRMRIILANVLLMALGDFTEDVIAIDGVSALFVILTEDVQYRIYPTGMGEGGTIHVVPVWSGHTVRHGKKLYYHLGKATDGAILGRAPGAPKFLRPDRGFLLHLGAHLKRMAPAGSSFIWLAATECGRPVSARQGYTVKPLLPEDRGDRKGLMGQAPLSFKATGGCGLGGNTAIIPEVQEILDRRS